MAQSTAAPPPFCFFFSRSPKPKRCSSALLPLPKRSISISPSSAPNSKARRSDADADADALYPSSSSSSSSSASSASHLEEQIFDFMRTSKKPHAFPTRAELLEAGRADLAHAVAAQGGWLAFGWDLERNPPPPPPPAPDTVQDQDQDLSSDNTALQAMLKRIQNQRTLAKQRKPHTQSSPHNPHLHPHRPASSNNKLPLKLNNMSNRPNFLPLHGETSQDYHILASENGKVPISNGSANSSTSHRWTRLNLSTDNSPAHDIKAGKVALTEVDTTQDSDTLKVGSDNGTFPSSRGSRKDSSLDMGDIRQRIQQLESSLNSALDSVRSRVKKVLSHEIDENTAVTLSNLSDDWEFQETEILKTKDEVRSLRARISVIEGKMALQIIEAQKLMEENQKKLDEARRHLSGLRNISVVWPNPASEVLLAGSFDGWTSKRSMEKSKEGMFSLNLMLYPGKYEIKFIVDGVWTVDPLRPVVKYSGHENNLLTVV